MSEGATMRVRANINVCGLRAGEVADVEDSRGVRAAIRSGWLEDLAPKRRPPVRRAPDTTASSQAQTPDVTASGSGSGEGDLST
jgi:hypothetical protein